MEITVTEILKYMQVFSITYIFTTLGAFIKELLAVKNESKKINYYNIFIPGIICSVIVIAIAKQLNISFELYVVLCIIFGVWGMFIVSKLTDKRVATNIAKKIVEKKLGDIGKSIVDVLDDDSEKETNKQENT